MKHRSQATSGAREIGILYKPEMVRAYLAGVKWQTRRLAVDKSGRPSKWTKVKVGDVLWGREPTIKVEDHGWVGPVFVESDNGRATLEWGYGESDDPDHIPPHAVKLRPGIHMPRWACRIIQPVLEVRIQRLQDISEEDAIAEGIEPNWIGDLKVGPNGLGGEGWTPDVGWRDYLSGKDGEPAYTAVASYRSLWEYINGPDSWDQNPEVVAITYSRYQHA